MPIKSSLPRLLALLALPALFIIFGLPGPAASADDKPAGPGRPALSVRLTQPQSAHLPLLLSANGSVNAWQEAILGAEVNWLRLKEVRAQVGDSVRRGQVLAVFAAETVEAELAQSRAAVAEAEAALFDAKSNAERAQSIAASGALSAQQIAQYRTQEKTAQARLASALAQRASQQLRLGFTRVLASDDGIISARSATVGAVAAQGQELFRMIRSSRLEWRGEVIAAELARLKPGLAVTVSAAGTGSIEGRLRVVAPTIDPATRNALVYVDLPGAMARGFKPGMFARGEFHLGESAALTVPQDAVLLSDGFAYVLRAGKVENGLTRVARVKVATGRRSGDAVEISAGLKPEDRVVISGVAFLSDGDLVKVLP